MGVTTILQVWSKSSAHAEAGKKRTPQHETKRTKLKLVVWVTSRRRRGAKTFSLGSSVWFFENIWTD